MLKIIADPWEAIPTAEVGDIISCTCESHCVYKNMKIIYNGGGEMTVSLYDFVLGIQKTTTVYVEKYVIIKKASSQC